MTATDPMTSYRKRFHIPRKRDGSDAVYLCGHSLGLQPKTARAYIEQEMKDWERLGVEGHFQAQNPWMPYHEMLTASMARLVGANADEVVVMNSLTVNLHLLMATFYRPSAQRHKILIEANAFPPTATPSPPKFVFPVTILPIRLLKSVHAPAKQTSAQKI